MGASDTFPVDPDYPIPISLEDGVLRDRMQSGVVRERVKRAPQRIFTLNFIDRPIDDIELIRAFKARLAAEHFVFQHKEWVNNAGAYLTRKFPVQWGGDNLEEELVRNNSVPARLSVMEAVGKALAAAGDYPDPTAGQLSFFIEEDDSRLAVIAGTWNISAHANAHGTPANERTNTNLNTTDKARFTYAGYGFALWARKNTDLGIFRVFLDGADLGTVDLYNASSIAAARVFSKWDVTLGMHTVDVVATNTKNAASTANTIIADALEVAI